MIMYKALIDMILLFITIFFDVSYMLLIFLLYTGYNVLYNIFIIMSDIDLISSYFLKFMSIACNLSYIDLYSLFQYLLSEL
jgi:hypothetical protein